MLILKKYQGGVSCFVRFFIFFFPISDFLKNFDRFYGWDWVLLWCCVNNFVVENFKLRLVFVQFKTADLSWIHGDCVGLFLWFGNGTWAVWCENLMCGFSVFGIFVRVMLRVLNCSSGLTILGEIVNICGQSGHFCNRVEVVRHLKNPHVLNRITAWTVF